MELSDALEEIPSDWGIFFFYIHIYCIISLYIFYTRPLQPSFTLAYIATVYTL